MKQKHLSPFLQYAVIASMLFVTFAAAYHLVQGGPSVSKNNSVEIGLAELSPKGEEGGYAVPASGSSKPRPFVATFTLSLEPNIVEPGEAAQLKWSWGQASGLGITHVTVTRCATPGNNAGNCSSWIPVVDKDGASFGGGSTSFTCFGFLPCHTVIKSGTSPLFGGKSASLTPGNYIYKAVAKFGSNERMSLTLLTVKGKLANLAPSPAIPEGDTLVKGNRVVFSSLIINNGTAPAGKKFTNLFQYHWGASGTWVTLDTLTAPDIKAGGQAITTSNYFLLSQAKALYVRLCADSGYVVDELDESDNCSTPVIFSIRAPLANLLPTLTKSGDPSVGEVQTFAGRVENWGTAPSSAAVARFCIDNANCASDSARSLGSFPVPALAVHEHESRTVRWTATLGGHTAYLCLVGGACSQIGFTITHTPSTPQNGPTQSEISLSSRDTLVRQGGGTTLTWSGGNSSSCTLTGTNGFSSSATGGSDVSSGVISQKTVFTLTCALGRSTKQTSVTINLIPEVQEI